MKLSQLVDTSKSIAQDYLNENDIVELLKNLNTYIYELQKSLDKDMFLPYSDGVYIHKSAKIENYVDIKKPTIICENAEIRHGAYIRGNVIIGKNAVVGNSTEIKNSILFDNAKAPHFNYVGDSILGFNSHIGAGVITSNVKSDKSEIEIMFGDEKITSNLKKFGAILGDNVEIGCNSVLAPGAIIGKNTVVYPLSFVRGYVPDDYIYKSKSEIIKKIKK